MCRKIPGKLIYLLLFIIMITGCHSTTLPDSDKPIVYTSIYPLYDFTQKIGGDKIIVQNIAPFGADPHSYEPSPRLIADLSQAPLFLYNGAGLEPYLEKLLQTLPDSTPLKVKVSQGLTEIKENEISDPHFWLSPTYAQIMGKNILEALSQIDPANQTYYNNNFTKLATELNTLTEEYQQTLAQCPRKKIIVTHQAFNYLCQEFGLEQIAIMGLQAEAEPTPGKLKEISTLIKEEKIQYIFAEAFYSPKIAITLAQETQTTILPLHPLGIISEEEWQAGKDYLQIMRENLENLKIALELKT